MMNSSRTEPAVSGPRSLRDPRSREYAIQTMESLKRFLESKSFDAKHVADELKLIEQHRHWEVLGFKDADAYLKAEVGVTLKALKRRLAQDLAADPAVPKLQDGPGHPMSGSNYANGIKGTGSNNAAYLVRRLKRDHPEIAEALARGEFTSARAAAIAAGIIKPKTAFEQIMRLLPKLTADERAELHRLLDEKTVPDTPVR
jgi:hypothetical protein